MSSFVNGRNESLGDGARGSASKKQLDKYNKVTHYGEVKEVTDDGTMRIKVFIRGVDKNDATNDELVYCHTLLPRMFSVMPKVGEAVKILLTDSRNTDIGRLWIGPIISQPERINKDPYFHTALSGRQGGAYNYGTTISTDTSVDGVYPGPDDVAILGRNNSDLLLKDNQVLIRAGKHEIDNPLKRNDKNPAYISLTILKPSDINKQKSLNTSEKKLNLSEGRTDTVVMSNKIFLIGRDSNSTVVKPNLSKEDHLTLESKLHPIVYGDILYEFMLLMRSWIGSHIHEGDRLKPDNSGDTVKLEEWFSKNLDRLLSKNIFAGGDVLTNNTNQQ